MARILDGEMVPVSVDEYRRQIQTAWQEILGEDYVLDDQTPQGQIIGLLSDALATSDETSIAMWNASRLETAIGPQLDWIGDLLGIIRNIGAYTRVPVVFTADPGIIIPIGTRVQSRSGTIFATWDSGRSGNAVSGQRVQVRSFVRGFFPVKPGEIDRVIDSSTGIHSVTNAVAQLSGADPETDSAYRRRLLRAKRPVPGMKEGLRARLLALSGVKEAIVLDNDTNAAVTRQGVSVPAGSIMAGVLGGDDRSIAIALNQFKPPGVPTSGTVETQLRLYSWDERERFARIIETQIKITIALTTDNTLYPPNGNDQIQAGVLALLQGPDTPLTVGASLDVFALYGLVYSLPGARITSITATDVNDVALPAETPLFTIYRVSAENVIVDAN